ncbi:MAG: hypothetical protein ABW128_06445 [Rhizorhabdus sp.]
MRAQSLKPQRKERLRPRRRLTYFGWVMLASFTYCAIIWASVVIAVVQLGAP